MQLLAFNRLPKTKVQSRRIIRTDPERGSRKIVSAVWNLYKPVTLTKSIACFSYDNYVYMQVVKSALPVVSTIASKLKCFSNRKLSYRRGTAMRSVNWNLANCQATVQKLLIRQVLTKSMAWSWRFSRRQCVIDNVHSTMTRSSRLPLSQVS